MKAKKLLSGLLTCALVVTSVFNGGLAAEVKAAEASALPTAIESYDFNAQTLSNNSVSGNEAATIGQNGQSVVVEPSYVAGRTGEEGDYAVDLAGTFGLRLDSKGVGEEWTLSTWFQQKEAAPKENNVALLVGGSNPQTWTALSCETKAVTNAKYKIWGYSVEEGNSFNWTTFNNTTLPVDEWTHVVFTQDTDAFRVYVDGKEVVNKAGAPKFCADETQFIQIGASHWADTNFNGYVDDVLVYDEAVSAAQVLEMYSGQTVDEWFADEDTVAFTVADTLEMYDNESKTINVALDALVKDVATVTFATEDTDVVDVNATTGEVTPVAAGEATVTVSVKVGDTTKTADVAVTVLSSRAGLTVLEAYDFNAKSLANAVSDNSAATVAEAGAASTATPVYAAGRSGEKGDYAAELGTYALKLNSNDLDNWAVSAWMKPTGNTQNNGAGMIIGQSKPAEQWFALAGLSSTSWKLWGNDAVTSKYAWTEVKKNIGMNMNEWNHVVFSQSGSKLDVFLNGTNIYSTTDAAAFLADAEDAILVGATYWGDGVFKGLVDDVQVYAHDLSAAEVAEVAAEEFVRDAEGLFENTTISATDKLELAIGATGTVEVTVDEGVEDVADISFESADEAVVTVSDNGVVTAVGAGRTTVTTTVAVGDVEKTATTNILVTEKEMTPEEWFIENGFSVAESELELIADGTAEIEVELNDKIKDVAEVSFEAADETVVSVDEDGVVTALAEGRTSVKVSVKVGETTKDFTVVVTVAKSVAVEYDFTQEVDGQVIDKSGNDNHATIVGDGISFDADSGIMTIDKLNSYLEMPVSIMDSLTDKEAFTIETTYARANVADDTSWVFCFGSIPKSTGTNYLFYCPRFSFGGNEVRAGIKNSSTEKLFSTGIKNNNEEFYTVNMVFDHGTIKLYLDGVKIGGQLDSGYSIMDDVVTPGTQNDVLGFIGGSTWAQDNEFRGQISSFKIYNKALTDTEVQSAPIFQKKLEANLQAAIEESEWLGKNASADEVRYNISLPSTCQETEIVWESTAPEVVSGNGIVYNGTEDKEVTLTGTVTSGALTASVELNVVVKALDLTELNAKLAEAKVLYDDANYEMASKADLKKAMDKASTVTTQTEADNVIRAIDTAMLKVEAAEIYLNPFTAIDASKVKDSIVLGLGQSGNTNFAVPAEIADLVTVKYTTTDASIATYTNGVVKAGNKSGYAVVTAEVTAKYDGFVMYYETLVYVNLDMSSVSVKAGATELAVGGKTNVAVSYDASVKAAGATVSYAARGAVAVDKSGNITAKRSGTGTVFVKVSAGGKSIRKAVTINVGEITGPSTVKVKKSITLKVKGLSGKVSWKVSNKKIATISSKGKLKAKKAGTVKVTATIGKIKLTKKIKVTK